uniref:N-acetyltransferase domain-containing protein n=1 Tax=viral metagenome TaxID=1070528 RepID=A0A6C0E674_9ZZZZ
MNIRKLSNDDYEKYIFLIGTKISYDDYIIFLQSLSDFHIIIVIELEGNLIATGTLIIEKKLTNNICYLGHIENIFVDDKHRNKGYGSIIINYLVKYATDKGCYRIDLICTPDITSYYKQFGFEETMGMKMLIKQNYKF